MANISYGYRFGERNPVPVRIDSSSSAIAIGDMLTLASAGYFKAASSGDEPYCVAMQACTPGAADGDVVILADFSKCSVYAYPPASGTATVALIQKTFDVGGAQSADIATGTDDSLICVDVDTTNNLVLVQINPTLASID